MRVQYITNTLQAVKPQGICLLPFMSAYNTTCRSASASQQTQPAVPDTGSYTLPDAVESGWHAVLCEDRLHRLMLKLALHPLTSGL